MRAPGAALAAAALLTLSCAGEARAAVACIGMPGGTTGIICQAAGSVDIDIDLANPAISTTGEHAFGVAGDHLGTGNIAIDVTGGSIATTGAHADGIFSEFRGIATGGAGGNIAIDVTGSSISTTGAHAHGISYNHQNTGNVDIDFARGSISTTGAFAYGIGGRHRGAGRIDIEFKSGSIGTTGENAVGIRAGGWSDEPRPARAINVGMSGGSIATTGAYAYGIEGDIWGRASGSMNIAMTGGSIATRGRYAVGVFGDSWSAGNIDIEIADGSIATTGEHAHGVQGRMWGTAPGSINIAMKGGSIATAGKYAAGIEGRMWGERMMGAKTSGSINIVVTGGSIATTGEHAHGVGVDATDAGEATALSIDAAGGAIAVEGSSARGLYGLHRGLGTISLRTGADSTDGAMAIETPFAIGIEAAAANDANAAGRILVTHRGAVEARGVGILAAAWRSSGHTMGSGAQTADDAGRTEPMIHVTSSGTIAVGGSVRDAFIEKRIAGADETMSEAEQAVFDAILTGGPSDALGTALAALPAAYDDAWKAEARALRAKRDAAPTGADWRGYRAAADILDLSRAGIRAYARAWGAIANYIRVGDGIVGAAVALSGRERTVLEAVLTGRGLEAALAALPDDYTTAWKNGVRQRAASYNAGDIRVDITGGSISAEGNGVEAFYAVPHDRNGAIAVAVAGGARVAGGRSGIYVRGAGAGKGNARAQTVTVNGAAMGGTGAGVYMAGGGALTIGATGEVGAASGVGVLADGGGDLTATVSGTVRGDMRVEGGGALTANVMAGGAVTGTIYDPASPMTVRGSVGRVLYLYDGGGTVTIAGGGAVTGVEIEGARETIRAASGDLSVTVAGRIEGDLGPAARGALTANVMAGGVVTGTLRNPQTPLTVAGSVGRVLYDNGGAVTVNAGGAVTGVEIDGAVETIRAASGDLSVAVAGRIEGDLRPADGGALTANVTAGGVVTGTIRNPRTPLAVSGSVGRILYDNGGAVTVNASGKITGIEIDGATEAIRSDAGDLAVTVHGTVTGNIEALGDGDLTVKVSEAGTVTGEIFGRGGGTHIVEIAEKAKVLGTVHNPKSGTTVHGAAGRVLFDNGGALTVAATGRIAGVGGEAVRADAGDLDVTVADGGAVTGRIEGRGAGDLTVNASGAVTGSVHGKGAGKHEVTVASGGAVTGDIVDFDAGSLVASVAGRLTGSIEERGAGDLTATVTGTVTGDIRGMGAGTHTVAVREGGSVGGTVRLPTSAMTIAGRVGRVHYDNGGSVTVAATGSIAGIERPGGVVEAIRSAAGNLTVDIAALATVTGDIRGEGDGDLDVDVSGTVKGNIFGLGRGEHDVDVKPGGSVEGLIHLEASTVTVHGSAGGIRFDRGGTVAVGSEGRIPGIEDAQGRRVAIVAEAGSLNLRVDGHVDGAVEARDADAASTVTVGADGAVEGKIALAGTGSEVTVDGVARSVDVPRGTVTVGENGRIEEPVAGPAAVTVTVADDETDEEAVQRVGGGRAESRVATVTLKRAGEDDVVLTAGGEGLLTLAAPAPAPRHRVYEALPSALLALNALPAHGDRLASAGAPRGAWARIDAGGGERRPASSTAGSRHDYRRFGFEAGLEGAAGDNALISVSVHHVRGRADVETDGGRIEIAGTGARVAGAWFAEQGFHASAQAAATLYEADLDSALDGALASDISGRGYAVGAEIGQRLDLGSVALTPRAGAEWSQVAMSSFTSAADAEEYVSLDAGRRITARAGLRADTGSVFATADVERELSGSMEMTAAGMALEAEAEDTWLRLGLGGVHEWADGRFILRGSAAYAAARNGNRDFAGNASLTVRF